MHIVMERCEGGALFDAITQTACYSERKAAAVFRKMVEMLHHCHELGVMHRDLKPENFLLTARDSSMCAPSRTLASTPRLHPLRPRAHPHCFLARCAPTTGMLRVHDSTCKSRSAVCTAHSTCLAHDRASHTRCRTDIKAIDFGISTFCAPGQPCSELVGSPHYVAPEVLRKSYTASADLWSLGVNLYVLLSGLPPFWGDENDSCTERQIFEMILTGDVDLETAPWPSISQPAKDLVLRLLSLNPAARCAASPSTVSPSTAAACTPVCLRTGACLLHAACCAGRS